jgi:hypothetical protein
MLDATASYTDIRGHIASTLRSTARTAKIFSQRLTILGRNGGMDVPLAISTLDKIQPTGLRPACDLTGGLRATIEFFRENLASIEHGLHL